MDLIKRWILKIKLLKVLSKLHRGRYEIQYYPRVKSYGVDLYNIADYGVYSVMYSINIKYKQKDFKRLIDCIDLINRYA